jgi:hypothetical protein
MMSEVPAIPIATILGSMATDDKKHVLIKAVEANGQEFVLAITPEELLRLIDCGAKTNSDILDQGKMKSGSKMIFDTSWFEIGSDVETGRTMLSITFGAGGTLNFGLPSGMPEQIYEILGVMLGKTTPASGGPTN